MEIKIIVLWERKNMVEPIKVGRFIAQNRKNLNLTQKELAEKLGVTDRAVSKWENGRSIPDVGIIESLCRIEYKYWRILCGRKNTGKRI